MSIIDPPSHPKAIHYPDSDGRPMSDNTVQFTWISILKWGLEAYLTDPNVFVAGDHLIYAVEGQVKKRQAPDVYVAFGRPKKDRGSYKVWEEDGIFPQVVFEVWSPGNNYPQMEKKFKFYQRYGAEEYYIIYPEPFRVDGWRRECKKLVRVPNINEWVSPRLGLRFSASIEELKVFGPDGRVLRNPAEVAAERDAERQRAEHERLGKEQERLGKEQEHLRAEQEKLRAEQEKLRAEQEKLRAEQERVRAEQEYERAEKERLRADQERQRAVRLADRLRELGLDPDKL